MSSANHLPFSSRRYSYHDTIAMTSKDQRRLTEAQCHHSNSRSPAPRPSSQRTSIAIRTGPVSYSSRTMPTSQHHSDPCDNFYVAETLRERGDRGRSHRSEEFYRSREGVEPRSRHSRNADMSAAKAPRHLAVGLAGVDQSSWANIKQVLPPRQTSTTQISQRPLFFPEMDVRPTRQTHTRSASVRHTRPRSTGALAQLDARKVPAEAEFYPRYVFDSVSGTRDLSLSVPHVLTQVTHSHSTKPEKQRSVSCKALRKLSGDAESSGATRRFSLKTWLSSHLPKKWRRKESDPSADTEDLAAMTGARGRRAVMTNAEYRAEQRSRQQLAVSAVKTDPSDRSSGHYSDVDDGPVPAAIPTINRLCDLGRVTGSSGRREISREEETNRNSYDSAIGSADSPSSPRIGVHQSEFKIVAGPPCRSPPRLPRDNVHNSPIQRSSSGPSLHIRDRSVLEKTGGKKADVRLRRQQEGKSESPDLGLRLPFSTSRNHRPTTVPNAEEAFNQQRDEDAAKSQQQPAGRRTLSLDHLAAKRAPRILSNVSEKPFSLRASTRFAKSRSSTLQPQTQTSLGERLLLCESEKDFSIFPVLSSSHSGFIEVVESDPSGARQSEQNNHLRLSAGNTGDYNNNGATTITTTTPSSKSDSTKKQTPLVSITENAALQTTTSELTQPARRRLTEAFRRPPSNRFSTAADENDNLEEKLCAITGSTRLLELQTALEESHQQSANQLTAQTRVVQSLNLVRSSFERQQTPV